MTIEQTQANQYTSHHIELNIPNILNYARFILLIYVMKIMSTSPFKSFFLTWLAGSLDMFDGYFARKYNNSSKFGAMLDFGMDRLTTMMQFFYLASVYPKYWFIFLLINSVELIRDLLLCNLNYYRNLLSLFELIKSNNNKNDMTMIKINENVYDNLGIKYSDHQLNKTLPTMKDSQISLSSNDNHLIEYFNYYIWYSSDVFFWLIYFASFISLNQNNSITYNKLEDVNINFNNSIRMRKFNLIKRLKISIYESLVFFDELAKFIQDNLIIYNSFNNNNNNSSPFIKITIACLIRFIIFACLIGSLLRFLTNLNSLNDCLFDIIQMDYKKIRLTSF